MRREAGALGGAGQQKRDLVVLDLVAAAAFLAQQQHALVGVADVLARRIGVAALDLVQEAVLEQELERAIDGRRRDRLAFLARQRVEDRVGAERGAAVAENVEHAASRRGQLQTLRRAGALHFGHPGRPAGAGVSRHHLNSLPLPRSVTRVASAVAARGLRLATL